MKQIYMKLYKLFWKKTLLIDTKSSGLIGKQKYDFKTLIACDLERNKGVIYNNVVIDEGFAIAQDVSDNVLAIWKPSSIIKKDQLKS